MRLRPLITALLLIPAAMGLAGSTAPADFRAALSRHVAGSKSGAIKANDGWYFLKTELRSYSVGPFWGDAATKTAVSPEDKDPLPAILDFHHQLKAKGITLIMVPVPGKVTVYADKLDPASTLDARPDEAHQQFYDLLRKDGITVIDLWPDFAALRKKDADAYCHQDTHWSPAAMELAASRIAEVVKKQPWYKDVKPLEAKLKPATVTVRGDLAAMLKDKDAPKETLAIQRVELAGKPVDTNDKSPLVLMGDSHTVVYHEELLADHAGLPDHLAAQLGLVLDMTGVNGSGANGSRAILARRDDNLAGKKCVIWCFSAREFTEANDGWQIIPILSDK